MAEGVNEAAQAFEQEIRPAPVANRSRDADTGRFVSSAKPEPLFAPRPIEGDPLTGDTRDGGEDPRLARMERRIADGRAEERNERQPVSDRAARAGQASADDEYDAADTEQGQRGAEEPGDEPQDAEGQDKRPDAQGASEQDARYEVNVDGQTMEVSLPEALKGYIREQTFHQRMTQVDTARQSVLAEAEAAASLREVYQQKLMNADRLLAELTPPEPDWDREFAADPHGAREKQKAYQAIYGKRAWLAQEHQQTQTEATQEYDRKTKDYAVRQFSQFVQEANIPDERALDSTMTLMREYARSCGFSDPEIATVYDKRMLKVLHDAALYRQSKADTPKPVSPGAGKTLTPGNATPLGNAPRRHIDDAQNKLARSGKIDDAAAVFRQLIRS